MTVENTRDRDPMLHVLGMLGGGGATGYIEDMEAAGQQQLVNSDMIPTDSPWDDLAELGFIKGEQVAGDELFTHVTLPEGWAREATSHSMHSDIVDQRGIARVGIFYKAAFYDRSAAAHVKHVAWSFVTDLLYGDEPVALPDKWALLTDDEQADYFRLIERELHSTREHVQEYPTLDADGHYTKRAARAEAALALRPAADRG